MNKFSKAVSQSIRSFGQDEEGAQVVEYALIIAVISIVLVLALQGLDTKFAALITRVGNCLAGATGCAAAP